MMRLKPHEILAIKEAVSRLDPRARVCLFGSRVFDSKKGGDIDILIFSDCLTYDHKISIIKLLQRTLGERKIDILSVTDAHDPFVESVMEECVWI
jgi:uncharacterized protein